MERLRRTVEKGFGAARLSGEFDGFSHLAEAGGGVPGEWFVAESHDLGELGEDPFVGPGFAHGVDGRLDPAQDVTAVRPLDLVLLQERHSGQDDVGVDRGVGHDLFVYDREEVFPSKTAQDGVLVGGGGDGIAVVDEERLDGG
jgi:hypothetical protein